MDHDQVGLPGVGTFVAEMVPASFSDKGYTINPPYRRLSFYPSRLEDTLLIDFYAASNQLDLETARTYITQYLAELKSVLQERKSIILPGLGRLRATRENALFFVADEGLDIYPAGVGLRPVSLKSHVLEEEPVVIDVPPPVSGREVEPIPQPEIPEEEEEECHPEPAEGSLDFARDDSEEEEIPDQVGDDEVPVGDDEGVEPANDEVVEPTNDDSCHPEPVEGSLDVARDDSVDSARDDSKEEEIPDQVGDDVQEKQKKPRWWLPVLLAVLTVAVIALAAFIILAQVAPDFIDSLLYTPEELEIINY